MTFFGFMGLMAAEPELFSSFVVCSLIYWGRLELTGSAMLYLHAG